jgi:hypothetical protein
MLNWVDLAEMVGYLTALLSVSVSYASRVQQQHYSDFFRQNEQLRQSVFSPFFGKIVMLLVALFLVKFFIQVLTTRKAYLKESYFNCLYVFFLGGLIEFLLWKVHDFTFIGAPMLIVGVLIIFFVEVGKVYATK